jgi:hypothetical protein
VAKSGVCTRGGGRRRRGLCTPDKKTSHFGLKFGEKAVESLSPRIEYDAPLWTQ